MPRPAKGRELDRRVMITMSPKMEMDLKVLAESDARPFAQYVRERILRPHSEAMRETQEGGRHGMA